VRDKILDRFDVVNGAGDEVAGALFVEETVRQSLHMRIDADHQSVHDAVGGDMREAAVTVTG
jgi:hypothetical protein